MNDPSGHCVNSTTTSQPEEISYDNNECWRLANTIGAMWDSTDYWSNRFTSREVFVNNVANNGHNGTDFFQGQLDNFFSSDEGKMWLTSTSREPLPPGDIDWADYVAVTLGGGFVKAAGIGEFSIIVDQYGSIYARVGLGVNTRGVSLSFGGALYNTAPDGNLFGNRIPIDQLNVSETERMQILKNVLAGDSASGSGTFGIGGFGGSVGLQPPYHATVEGIIAGPGASVAPISRTYLIWGQNDK